MNLLCYKTITKWNAGFFKQIKYRIPGAEVVVIPSFL